MGNGVVRGTVYCHLESITENMLQLDKSCFTKITEKEKPATKL